MVNQAARARRIAAPAVASPGRSNEAVFKLLSATKSRASAQNMVRYAARVRKQDRDDPSVSRVQLFDGDGEVLNRADLAESFEAAREAADRAFEALRLRREEDNLKAAARKRRREAAEAGAPPAEDLRNVVAYHFAFSVPIRQASDLVNFELAVRGGVEENFTDKGYDCLWAIHGGEVAGEGESAHAHVHAHMVVKAEHRWGGRRLRFGSDPGGRDVKDFRESFAEHARAMGLAAEATWREDRAEVRRGVAEGRETLRPHRDHKRSRLARRAPDWALAYEPAAIRRREESRLRRQDGEPAWPSGASRPVGLSRILEKLRRRRRPGSAQARLEERLEGLYADPGAAVSSWRELRSELEERGDKPSYADWWMVHRPEAFGDPLAPAFDARGNSVLAGDRDFRGLLREAAAEMPRTLPPRPEATVAAARRQGREKMDALVGELAARDRRSADLATIARRLGGVAATVAAEEPALASAVRSEAAKATVWANQTAEQVRRELPSERPRPEEAPEESDG